MHVRWAGAMVLAALLCAASARAQDLKPGDKVRLSGPSDHSLRVVYVVESGPDVLVVRRDKRDTPFRVPLRSLERLEVARGKRRMWAEGMTAGLLFGAVTGATAGGEFAAGAGGAATGGLFCAVVGSLVGLTLETDEWKRVDTRPRPRVGLVIVPGPAPAAGLRVSF